MASIDDKYVKIQGWMIGQLGLTGSELMIYARIYSFQYKEMDGKDVTKAAKPVEISAKDFMEWTRINKPNVIKTIQRLSEKGLITIFSVPGHVSSYSINIRPIKQVAGGIANDTGIKTIPVSQRKRGGIVNDTTGGIANDTRVVSLASQTGIARETHRQQTTIDNNKTTKTTLRPHACVEADASSLSTDTETAPEKDYGDYSKAEIAFFEKQALNRLNETDPDTDQKKYLTSNPQDQYPKAFLFMTAKNSSQFTDIEFELYKMALMYTAYGKIQKNAETVSQEEAEYVPPASEIGQEAHDAQQKFVDWVFHDGASPIQMARRK